MNNNSVTKSSCFKNLVKARSSIELLNNIVENADNYDFKYQHELNAVRIDISSKIKD